MARTNSHFNSLTNLMGEEALAETVAVYADETFARDLDLEFGGQRIEIRHRGPAHTLGDSFVWMPEAGVMFTGDIVYVDLIGVVHIGEQEYYEQLNGIFEKYDAMLYELVAPKDAVVTGSDSEKKGLVSRAQIGMKNLLDLSFQLDEIDYTASNFVHADLSPTELFESMDERGESHTGSVGACGAGSARENAGEST